MSFNEIIDALKDGPRPGPHDPTPIRDESVEIVQQGIYWTVVCQDTRGIWYIHKRINMRRTEANTVVRNILSHGEINLVYWNVYK